MTTILIKKKDTAGAPAPGDLTNAAGGTEIAVNTATRRIYTKDSTGTVVELGNNATSSTIADLTVTNSTTLSYGTANQVQYLNGSKLLVGSANMTFNGTTLTVNDLTDSSLTATRVVYAGTGGNLADSANLTFNGTTLTANALTVSNAVTLSGGTANGVTYLNGSKALTSGSDFTFDGTYLTLGATQYLRVQTTTSRANVTIDADLVSENGLGILSTSTTYGQGYQYIRLFNSSAAYTGSISQTASTGIGLYSAGDLVLGANSATVVTVAPTSVSFFGNSQNNTWGVNYKALDVNGSFVTANGGNTIAVGTGAYLSAAGNWTRTTDSASSTYTQSVGGHVWAGAPASTIGSTITYTNQALLLGIGTSTNLQVGSVSASGGAGGNLGMFLSRGAATNFYEAFDGTKSFIGGVDNTLSYAKVGTLSGHDLAVITGNGSKIFIQNSTGKVIVGGGGTPYGKLFVDDASGLNQNSLTISSTNSASAGDWAAMEHAFVGSWSTNQGSMALINVTDNLNSSLTASTVGQYGIGFDGGGFFAVKRLYNGSYGGSGVVFKAGISNTYFAGTTTQDGTVSTQAGIVTTTSAFDIPASTNRRVQVSLSNYTWTKFRIYGLRTNSGNSIILWEGVLNNNFNTSFTNVIASVSGGGTLSVTVSSPSSGVWNFDFNNSGSGGSGYYVKEDPGYGTVTVTTY